MMKWTFYYKNNEQKFAWSFVYDKDSITRFDMLKHHYDKNKETLKQLHGITIKPYKIKKEMILREYL